MKAVKIGDGMGNQLLNYACGYAQARRENDSLLLDISESDNSTLRDFELDKFHLKYDKKESFPNHNLPFRIIKEILTVYLSSDKTSALVLASVRIIPLSAEV